MKDRFNVYGQIFINLLDALCKSVSSNIGYKFSTLSLTENNEIIEDNVTKNTSIGNWESKISINNKCIIMECYTQNKSLFKQQMGNSFYDKQRNSYPVFDCLMARLQTEILNIIAFDYKNDTITIEYPNDKEIIMYNAVADFLYDNGKYQLDFLNRLSSMAYESHECNGRVMFCNLEYEGLQVKDSFFFGNEYIHIIRKLLELTDHQYYLVINPDNMAISGIVSESQCSSWVNNYVIQFYGHMHWKLFKDNMSVIECLNGIYYIVDEADNLYKEKMQLENIFSGDFDTVKRIMNLIKIIRKQKRGTMIVVSGEAKDEAERLCGCNRAISVNEFQAIDKDEQMLLAVTSIDGALILDLSLTCWAIGAILDGPASRGKVSRGARYNSALSYMKWKKEETVLIIVISEDGMVNLVYDGMEIP